MVIISDNAMLTNNSFSVKRFVLLCKQSLIINKRLIGLTLTGFVGTLFFALIFLQSITSFREWDTKKYMAIFLILFSLFGMIYSSLAFPAFRSKEKSMTYLMLPASTSEKYIFEFLTRIVLYILIMPFLYWSVVNIEVAVIHYYMPEFTFGKIISIENFKLNGASNRWTSLLVTQGFLFLFILTFTGASYFSKSPLLKTLFSLSLIIAGYALLSYLLFKGLNIQEYHHSGKNRILLDKDKALAFGAILATLTNLTLLAIAYFRLKEKEV